MSPRLIPDGQSLFVVDLHYVAPLETLDAAVPAHVAFLKANYAAGRFVASGRKVPRTGGVILATAESREALMAELAKDPFHRQGLAEYTVTEFVPTMRAPQLDG